MSLFVDLEAPHGGRPRTRRLPKALWLASAAIVVGFGALEAHALRAGAGAEPPAIVADRDGEPRMLVFLHPLCPCSRATATELERIASRAGPLPSIRVLFLADEASPVDDDDSGGLRRRVERIAGVVVEDDPGGARAREYGARTSGTVLYYGRDGALLFDGGITGSRGHEGDNPSARALVERIELGRGPRATTPVFGCALWDPTEEKAR